MYSNREHPFAGLSRVLICAVAILSFSSIGALALEEGTDSREPTVVEVTDFKKVTTSLPGKTVVTPGNNYRVEFFGDEAVVNVLSATVSGDTLEIKPVGNFESKNEVLAYVYLPAEELTSLEWTGAATMILLEGFGGLKSLELLASGAGNGYIQDLNLDNLDIEVSSAGSVYVYQTKDASITVSGPGDVHVKASGKVTVDLTSVGDIEVQGAPTTEITGTASSIGRVLYAGGTCGVQASNGDIFGQVCQQISATNIDLKIPDKADNIPHHTTYSYSSSSSGSALTWSFALSMVLFLVTIVG